MAAGKLAAPGKIVNGEEIGPCVNECQHIDCKQTREMAAAPCVYCDKPIGYETYFYQHAEQIHVQPTVGRRLPTGFAHARCLHERIEK
mgnify:CR=1 FL=1